MVTIKRMQVQELKTDLYQRLRNEDRISKIAKSFDERLLGVPLVNVRANGEVYIVDGQHRIGALVKNGVNSVDCRVVYGLTKTEEAEMFISSNILQKRLSGVDLFFASLEARLDWAVRLKKVYESHGYKIGRKRTKTQFGQLTAAPTAAIVGAFRSNPDAHAVSLDMIVKAWNNVGDTRLPETAFAMSNTRLITGVQAAVQGWCDRGCWDHKLQLATVAVLAKATPQDWIEVAIPASMNSLPNADRGSCATAQRISTAVAKHLKDTSLTLEVDEVLTSASFRKGGQARAFDFQVA